MSPRILFTEQCSYPIQIERGDIVFISGVPPPGRELPWEHAAIVGEPLIVNCESDFLDLWTYGLPESRVKADDKSSLPGLHLLPYGRMYAKLWDRYPEWQNLCGPMRCWNFGARPFGDNLGYTMFEYPKAGNPFPPVLSERKLLTTCTGFVCWALRLNRLDLVHDEFGFRYPSPYTDGGERTWPSPGHVALALTGTVNPLPYCPRNVEEAISTSTVVKILANYQLSFSIRPTASQLPPT